MGGFVTVDPSQVQTITVDPDKVQAYQPKPYDASKRGVKLNGKAEDLPDTFLGTLGNDIAAIPKQALALPFQAIHAAEHPLDALADAWHAISSIPADTHADLKAGKYGKVGARLFELFAPILGSEAGAAAISRGASGAAKLTAPAADAMGTAVAAVKGAAKGAAEKIPFVGPVVKGAAAGAADALAERAALKTAQSVGSTVEQLDQLSQALGAGKTFREALPVDQERILDFARRSKPSPVTPQQPRAFVGPQQPPAEAAPVAPDPLAGKTVADLIAEEFARAEPPKRGPVRPPLAEPAPPPPEAAEVPPAAAPRVPLQPPIAAAPVAETAAPTAPAPRTLAQTEAAMAQKAPPPFDPAAARSPVHENGELKSPQLRAEEIKRGNAEAKAARIAQALHDFEVPPESISKIPMERYTAEQIAQGATPGWPNIIDELVKHGKLPAGEKPPTQSLPFIQKYMRKLAADRLAQRLADEMKRSGTVQDVMGVNGKTTVGEMMQQ